MHRTIARRIASILAALLGAGAVAHCDRSEPSPYRQVPFAADTAPCPCGAPAWLGNRPWAFLRVTVLAREEGPPPSGLVSCRYEVDDVDRGTVPGGCDRLALRVEEQISGDVELAAGDEIEVITDDFLPCSGSSENVAVGALAFASVSWPPAELPECAARQPCLDACAREYAEQPRTCELDAGRGSCVGVDLDECRGSCEGVGTGVCPPRPPPSAEVVRSAGSARLAPWGNTILFAQSAEVELRVAAGDLDELSGDVRRCRARHGDWTSLPVYPGYFRSSSSAP